MPLIIKASVINGGVNKEFMDENTTPGMDAPTGDAPAMDTPAEGGEGEAEATPEAPAAE